MTLSDLLTVVLVTECVLAIVAVTVTSVHLTRPRPVSSRTCEPTFSDEPSRVAQYGLIQARAVTRACRSAPGGEDLLIAEPDPPAVQEAMNSAPSPIVNAMRR